MNRECRRVSISVLVTSVLASSLLMRSAFAVDPIDLRNKQDAQQRARTMTKELISNVLDIQIQQLEENGLEDLPVFKDIQSMRTNIDGLVETQMNRVIELLIQAQQGTKTERDAAFKQARGMIREIVLKLVSERQTLLRRLKTAEIVAQVKRLIELESSVLKMTKVIPTEKQTRQEQLALASIEDQRDVKELFLQLVETFVDIRSWGGPMGGGATDALRILKAADIGRELDQAGQNLESAKYDSAAKNQDAIVKGLRMILEKIEGAQGLINSDRQAVMEMIQAITKLQEDVRDQTQQAEQQNQNTVEKPLIDQQSKVQQDLGQLAQALEQAAEAHPQLKTLLEHAKVAAQEARAELFEGKLADAQQDQGEVLGNLAEMTRELQQANEVDAHDLSAAQLAQRVKELAQARSVINQAQVYQDQAAQTAVEEPAIAKGAEQQAAAQVMEAAKAKLPGAVQSRLAEAEAAMQEAATELATTESTHQRNLQAVENAAEALERAAAEVEAALADAQREHMAVKIGELARAAEAIERAAAAERNIADEANEAARKQGLDQTAASALRTHHSDVKQVAKKIAEAIQDLASAATKTLEDSQQGAAGVDRQLELAPAETGEAAQSVAKEVAQGAENTASQLAKSAAQIREEIQRASKDLDQITDEQLAAVRKARGAVETTQAQLPESHAAEMQRLEAAAAKIHHAQQDQQQAAGRPDAARSLALIDQIKKVLDQQMAADEAYKAFGAGKSNTPLDAAAQQQAVADESKKAAEQAAARPQAKSPTSDSLKTALEQARSAAQEAAKEMLNGERTKTEVVRTAAKNALHEAQQLALAEAVAAQQAPAGKPDTAAQKLVGRQIQEAQTLTADVGQEVAKPLTQAAEQSSQAEQRLVKGENGLAQSAQEMTVAALAQAKEQVQAAQAALMKQQAEKFHVEGKQADTLASSTAKVDAGATGAVQTAERTAEAGAINASQARAGDTTKTQQVVLRALEQAAAALAAREQQIRRDQAIAQTLGDLAEKQQTAADTIALQRDALKTAAEAQRSAQPQSTPKQRQAARALSKATQDFAEAQRATGEGAKEISGQSEVANPPLREALEMASNLNSEQKRTPPPSTGEETVMLKSQSAQDERTTGKQQKVRPPKGESPNGVPQASAPPESEPHQNDPMGDQRQAEASGGEAGQSEADQKLGTGIVPNAPQATAQQIAGKAAMKEMQLALADEPSPNSQATTLPLPKGPTPGQPDAAGKEGEGQSSNASEGQSDLAAKSSAKSKDVKKTEGGRTSKTGITDNNDAVKDGAVDDSPIESMAAEGQTDKSQADSDAQSRKQREEPWFIKLPPDLRKAIRAKSQRRAPKGYEERLKRYFESID